MPQDARARRVRRSSHPQLAVWVAIVLASLAAVALCIAFVDTAVAQSKPAWLNSIGVETIETLSYWAGGWPLAPSLLAVALIWAGVRWRRFLLTFAVAYLIRTAAVEGLKWLTGRPRPREMEGLTAFHGPGAGFSSFPSGHAAFGFMFAVLLSAYFPRYKMLWYAGAVVISAARVTSDSHFVSDIVLGGLIGTLMAMLALRWWPPEAPGRASGQAPATGASVSS